MATLNNLNKEISKQKLQILRHSLGYDLEGYGVNHRNYYSSGEDCDNHSILLELVEEGLMYSRDLSHLAAKLKYFYVTELGRKIVNENKPPIKRLTAGQKRYQAFLDFDGSLSFLEFCKLYDAENKKRNL